MKTSEKAIQLVDNAMKTLIFTIKQEIKVDTIKVSKLLAINTVNEILEALQKDKWNNEFWINYYKEVKIKIEKI